MEVEPRKLVVALVLVFLLGISFALLNGYYVAQEGEALPLVVYGLAFLSVLVGAFVALLFQWKVNASQLEKILGVLPRDERLVIKALLDNSGRLAQNYLVALTGLHKVAVSRAITKLEARGVVEKRPMGNTNMVLLKL